MSAKPRTGFYLGKKSALLLALLPAVSLLALLVLAILYGRCARQPPESVQLRSGSPPPPPGASVSAAPPPPGAKVSAAPPAGPSGPWDQPRLPRHVTPIHYSLRLWPHLAPGLPEPRTHAGQVNITVWCREATATVLLHSVNLTYGAASVWGPLEDAPANGSRSIPLAKAWVAAANQYLVLELLESLRAGGLYELRFAFQGKIQLVPNYFGLFLNTYEDQEESRWMVVSQLQPTAARNVYPCFDEPAMKATFNTSIVHHPSYVALSNMPALDVSEYKDVNENTLRALMNETTQINWTITTFETTPKMSTYITAFVVCKLDYVTTTERGNQIRIWARKDAVQKGLANYALNITGPIFSFMEDLLNISYHLSKTDMVAVPYMFHGAMENWGLMIFDETLLLTNSEDNYKSHKMQICQVVAHEIAHQWFGNLVTMDWWNDIWLNEGFATYFEYLGLDYIEHTMPLNKLFSKDVVLPMLMIENPLLNQSVSVTDKTREADSLLKLFSTVTYTKAACIIRMLSNFMTEGLLIKALNSYLSAFSFSNAIQDDLWNHIQKVIDEQNDFQLPASVKTIMDSWTCQKGFPLLTVDVSTGNISQEPFFTVRGERNSDMWIIPISWIKNGTLQPLVWLDKRSKIFPEMKISNSEHDWIVLNVNLSAYYRINYDQAYWRKLSKVLEGDPKPIPSVSRLQLLTDAFHLIWSNHTEYETSLYLTKYLEKEDDLTVWMMALDILIFYDRNFILRDPDLYLVLKKYLLPRITPIYRHYANLLRESHEALDMNSFTKRDIEKILTTACWLGLHDCLNLASEFFNKWMNSSKNEVPVCFSTTICCYGIWMGNEEEWEFLFKNFKQNETDNAYRSNIFVALSCSRMPWLLQRYLHYTLNDEMDIPIMTAKAIRNVVRNEIGYWTAWTFVSENLSNLPIRLTLEALMSTVTTDIEIQMMQVFLNAEEPEERIEATDRILKKKSENEKIKKYMTKITMWLKENMDN